nr:retrovirus-related Pol polyprotein from transposon TNT 1-94 [Tanacetum cinerariifolium]
MVLVYGEKHEDELKVSCYADASFQTDKDDTKSQTRYMFMLNGGAIDWKSAKQSTTAMSSTEAEYIAAAKASIEAVWMRKFINGLGGVMPSNKRHVEMLCDYEPTLAIASDLRILKGAKHFQSKYHYIREAEALPPNLVLVAARKVLASLIPWNLARCYSGMAISRVLLAFISLVLANICYAVTEDIQCAGSDTRPPMLDRTDFASWQQCIRLYCQGKENEVNILKSIDEGPFQMETVREPLAEGTEGAPYLGSERPRVYSDLSPEEKDWYNANIKATNILLQGLPKDIYTHINHYTDTKYIWDNMKMLLEGSELTKEDRELQMYDDFEHFQQHRGETIHEYYIRFAKLINDMRNIKMTMVDRIEVKGPIHEVEVQLGMGEFRTKLGMLIQVKQDKLSATTTTDLALNVDNVFQADDYDAFDSDVDEAPMAQTMFMANLSSTYLVYDEVEPSPKPYYNELNKVAIGYKNPLCITRAKQVQPALYNGHEIIKDNHVPTIVHNIEDTLEIAEITQRKMNDKMKDPQCVTHKVKIVPHDYSKENFLATFTPKKQLTPEQIFWSQYLIKMKSEALKEQTTALRPIKALTVYPLNTPNLIKPVKRELHQLGSLGERGFEQSKECYLKESWKLRLPKMLLIGNMIRLNNLLIANDNLITECLSKEVFSIVTNLEPNVARFTEIHVAYTIVEARCLELKVELSNLRGKYDIDVEPLPSHLRNNKEAHLDYLRHLKESVETIHDIVEEAKVVRPLDSSIVSACRYTKHSQELLEYTIGTSPQDSHQ